MYLGLGGRGTLAAEMRARAALLIALFGIASIPGVSAAAPGDEPSAATGLHVTVTPASGSRTTHFRISLRTAPATGVVGSSAALYRLTASVKSQGKCQSSVSVVAPSAPAGAVVHVTLAPAAHRHWCAGMFRGQVWYVLIAPCPVAKACPAILPLPQMVGRFTFRVRRS
jgi:hypothetical protein